ncbi:S26 family signal peptidase [Dyella monticola]|uniref:S26 family signal peptidase n=1 Tax=Dyella monticola TaxID=1927958 RepID=A0A370X9U6_9GAMM|nr:S26 family signal peptidase [Dyella monticola]RDS85030.1 S26 family signal peptidase [Dyella monticola]
MRTVSRTDTVPRPRVTHRRRFMWAALSACGVIALAWASFMSPRPRLIYNPSESVAVGWYHIDPREFGAAAPPVGSLVLVPLPAYAAELAAWRGYLPRGIPLLKPVAAVAPQRVCVADGIVRIDGVPVAAVLRIDGRGRPLHAWPHCRRLRPGELFLLGTTNPASFDSRYFGPVRVSAVLGIAHPIWLETRR